MIHNKCPKCGHYENQKFRKCPACGADTEDGSYMPENACPTCQGTGLVRNPNAGTCDTPWETCPRCHGAKTVQ